MMKIKATTRRGEPCVRPLDASARQQSEHKVRPYAIFRGATGEESQGRLGYSPRIARLCTAPGFMHKHARNNSETGKNLEKRVGLVGLEPTAKRTYIV